MSDINLEKKISSLREKNSRAIASFNVLFQEFSGDGLKFQSIERHDFIRILYLTLKALENDLETLLDNPSSALRYSAVVDENSDSIDSINSLARLCLKDKVSFFDNVEAAILEVLTSRSLFDESTENAGNIKKELIFLFKHSHRFCEDTGTLFIEYLKLLEILSPKKEDLPRVEPAAFNMKFKSNLFHLKGKSSLSSKMISKVRERAGEVDPFHGGRAFRFMDARFYPANLSSIRLPEMFFGFPGARSRFRNYLKDFAEGRANPPLLISSLPGLGKTHFTISYTLSNENLTLILPEPCDLEKSLEDLIRRLRARKNHKFVLFFDDVDPATIDWYYFRTNVGGSFSLPDNIAIIIASNYKFPANISSRGRGFIFPIFDELKCQEMVHDFLVHMGMRKPTSELISVIASDYMEEFGQKMFEELSPRTLVRYLERYERDFNKRKRMLDLSREEVIARPDPQLFYDVNVRLIKSLYGEEGIRELQEERLGEL